MLIRILVQDAKPMQIHADSDPGQTSKPQKVNFYMKIHILNVVKGKKYT
jgi:hypothetical protein